MLITPIRHGDARGWFSEVFRQDRFDKEIPGVTFVQHNQSYSAPAGTVRGLHFQLEPRAQGKLVLCPRGRVLDVAVDLRTSSQTCGHHVAVELSAENGQQLWIPSGFAHGFCRLEDDCNLAYLVTDYCSPEHDRALRWNDPTFAVGWPVDEADAVLSPKDARQPLLAELRIIFA